MRMLYKFQEGFFRALNRQNFQTVAPMYHIITNEGLSNVLVSTAYYANAYARGIIGKIAFLIDLQKKERVARLTIYAQNENPHTLLLHGALNKFLSQHYNITSSNIEVPFPQIPGQENISSPSSFSVELQALSCDFNVLLSRIIYFQQNLTAVCTHLVDGLELAETCPAIPENACSGEPYSSLKAVVNDELHGNIDNYIDFWRPERAQIEYIAPESKQFCVDALEEHLYGSKLPIRIIGDAIALNFAYGLIGRLVQRSVRAISSPRQYDAFKRVVSFAMLALFNSLTLNSLMSRYNDGPYSFFLSTVIGVSSAFFKAFYDNYAADTVSSLLCYQAIASACLGMLMLQGGVYATFLKGLTVGVGIFGSAMANELCNAVGGCFGSEYRRPPRPKYPENKWELSERMKLS